MCAHSSPLKVVELFGQGCCERGIVVGLGGDGSLEPVTELLESVNNVAQESVHCIAHLHFDLGAVLGVTRMA